MISKLKKQLEEVIQHHTLDFYWGRKWWVYSGKSIELNIAAGYAYSHKWWERFFQTQKVKDKCVLLELAYHYWTKETDINDLLTLSCIPELPIEAMNKRVYRDFMTKVVYPQEAKESIFNDKYVWDIYVVLVKNKKVRSEVMESYQSLKW